MESLDLAVLDYRGPTRWRWRLTQPGGRFVADYAVDLDERAAEYEAFVDLYRYLRWHAAPDRRQASETEILAQVGRWIGEHVLGPVGPAMVARAPVTVRLRLPTQAAVLGYRPLELGWVAGRPLAMQQVSLVIQETNRNQTVAGGKRPVGERLRMLAVFSLPVDTAALSLRRERYELARLVHHIAQVNHKAIELRVLQYGVTRQRLDDVLVEAEGWDVLHISGHGLPAGLLLETADGGRDLISSPELVDLLDPARSQLKLVTLSSCDSAAATAVEHLRLLGIGPVRRHEHDDHTAPVGEPLPALASALVTRLGCAVLAMRYPVDDEFAITLGARLYELLLGKGQPLPRALQLVLPRLCSPASEVPALSVATRRCSGRWRISCGCCRRPGGRWCSTRPRSSWRTFHRSRCGSSAGSRSWPGLPPRWPPTASTAACCSMGWPERARPHARWSWPTVTSTASPGWCGTKRPSKITISARR